MAENTIGKLGTNGPYFGYKGISTINHVGNFGFMITGIDGDPLGGGGPDKFRIKIWDKDDNNTIVYDNEIGLQDDGNPSTELQGGSIVVHKVKK